MERSKQERVLQAMRTYRFVDGRVQCKVKGIWSNKVATVVDGYRQHILFGGRGFGKVVAYEHDIAWLFHFGLFDGTIYHLDGDRSNNRVENLSTRAYRDDYTTSCAVTGETVRRLFDSYLDGKTIAKASVKAGVSRQVGMYHIGKMLRGEGSTYLDVESVKDYEKMFDARRGTLK